MIRELHFSSILVWHIPFRLHGADIFDLPHRRNMYFRLVDIFLSYQSHDTEKK
jgi:hypothetical protein